MSAEQLDREQAAAADRLVRQAGLQWPEALVPPALPAPDPYNLRGPEDAALFCVAREAVLTPWEREFAHSIAAQTRPLSPKQQALLARLVDKCRKSGAAW